MPRLAGAAMMTAALLSGCTLMAGVPDEGTQPTAKASGSSSAQAQPASPHPSTAGPSDATQKPADTVLAFNDEVRDTFAALRPMNARSVTRNGQPGVAVLIKTCAVGDERVGLDAALWQLIGPDGAVVSPSTEVDATDLRPRYTETKPNPVPAPACTVGWLFFDVDRASVDQLQHTDSPLGTWRLP